VDCSYKLQTAAVEEPAVQQPQLVAHDKRKGMSRWLASTVRAVTPNRPRSVPRSRLV
jgi:hypothetical protein